MGSILVVDDERSIRFTVKAFLENENHTVETAEDVQSALAILKEEPIDVVLTDIIMPKMSGVDLLKEIRKTSPDVPVVMMTGEPTLETASESLRLGAIDYLQKPIGRDEMLKVVRNALQIRSLNDEKKRLAEENRQYLYHLEQLVEQRTQALTESEASTRRRADELAVLNHLARVFGSNITLDATVQSGLQEIARAAGSDMAVVFLRDCEYIVHKGLFIEGKKEGAWEPTIAHRAGECLCGLAISEEKPVYSLDIHTDFRCTLDECKNAGLTSFVALPLYSGAEMLGVLGLATSAPKDFSAQGSFLEALANELSIGLKKSLLYEELQKHALELQTSIEQTKAAEAERLDLVTRLQQAQKMEAIGVLAGGIAHDFNNILSAVLGYAELGISRAPADATIHHYLEQILGAGLRAKDLVQQILTFSRQCETEVSPIRVSAVAKEALKLLRASLPATIEIRQNIQSDLVVMADPTSIHQVMMNLCTNAAHAMREKGGILAVNISDLILDSRFTEDHTGLLPGQYLRLKVSDTGQGMSKFVKDRIFDPFFTTKKKGEGTGLGLSVVHGIIKGLNGHITVNSKPGQGASFELFLPAALLGSAAADREEEATPRGDEHILLVDDEKSLVDVNTHLLQSLGYEVTGVTSAPEALDMFRSQPDRFDVVITDMTMPQMTGDILAKALLEIRPDLPVVICTGFSSSLNAENLADTGARALLHKPILKQQIAETIRQVLESDKDGNGQ